MDELLPLQFQGVSGLEGYCFDGKFEDVPLSNELLDDFGMDSYHATALGELQSPNPFNPDLLKSSQQSPILPDQSQCAGSYALHTIDGRLGAGGDFSDFHLPQQSQDSHTGTDIRTSNNHPSNRILSDTSERSLKRSSSHTNGQQYQNFMAQPEGTLCVKLQRYAEKAPSNTSVEPKTPNGTSISTQMPVTPKALSNTLSTSIPANLQSSPISRPQHFVRHPSNLRNQIHPETSQDSPSIATVTKNCTNSKSSHTTSSSPKLNHGQEPNASPSYQNTGSPSDRTQSSRITSVHNQSCGSPVLQNPQPFQESGLRSPLLSNSGQTFWDAGQVQTMQYPDPRLPYTGHHYVSELQKTCTPSYSPVQYRIQAKDSEHAPLVRQGSADFSFNGSSPLSMQRQVSCSGSDRMKSSPILGSLSASPKPQKKRRVKQETKKDVDNEGPVDPIALQTADLMNLNPRDHANIAALIHAMHNTDNVEDNEGMQKTWEKVRKVKAIRIKEVCIDLLVS